MAGIVKDVLKELWPYIEKEKNLHLNSEAEAVKLESNLKKIKDLLDLAENVRRSTMDDPELKRQLQALEDLAYNMEDAVDDWNMSKLDRQAIQGTQDVVDGGSRPWTASFLEKCGAVVHCPCDVINKFLSGRRIVVEITDLNGALEANYDKVRNELKSMKVVAPSERPKTIAAVVEAEIHGRDSDKETIKRMLIEDTNPPLANKSLSFSVVGIVGEGGLGKTALAQLVYNDAEVRLEFKETIWVCVSNTFDEVKVAQEILEGLENKKPEVSSFNQLAEKIKHSLGGKKFLLVLDDVWVEEHTKWTSMKSYLNNGMPGSKIVVTTRNARAVSALGATETQIHHLQLLENDACWSIIKQLALQGKDEIYCRSFKDMAGNELAKRCKGSPLAACILGAYLSRKKIISDWQDTVKSKIWERNVENKLFPHFFLSYDELEPAVKRCFSYCAIFPKDSEINVDRLIRIWRAQGFLSSAVRDDEIEMIGKEYFEDLAQRCFFQNFDKDEFGERIVSCKMHDIVHDFAQYLTQSKCLTVDGNANGRIQEIDDPSTIRHLLLTENVKSVQISISNLNFEKLRSFSCYMSKLPRSLVARLKYVRELTLFISTENIPGEIEKLLHLRYLCLICECQSLDVAVPEFICNFYHLHSLYLEGFSFDRLPDGIYKLMNLRHIHIGSTMVGIAHLFVFPEGLGRLTNLWELNYFNGDASKLGCLQNLNQLRGELCITLGEEGEVDVEEARIAALSQKEFLQSLVFVYEENFKVEVVEALIPHPNLKSLKLSAKELPSWVPSIICLRKLKIKVDSCGIDRCSSKLANLGKLQFLEDVSISITNFEHLGRDFLGLTDDTSNKRVDVVLFPALRKLRFMGCHAWEEWDDISEEDLDRTTQILPQLTELKLEACPNLKGLPHRLLQAASSLQHLVIGDCSLVEQGYHDGGKDMMTSRISVSIIEADELEEVSEDFNYLMNFMPILDKLLS